MSDPVFGAESPDDARARLDQWTADAKAKAQRYQAMKTQAAKVSVSATSPDGVVTATVDSAGNVSDLRITDKIQGSSGEKIASLVLTTIRRAQAQLPEKLREVMAETIGEDQGTIDTIVGNYQARFPEPVEDEPAASKRPDTEMKIGVPEDDDEDWGNRSITR